MARAIRDRVLYAAVLASLLAPACAAPAAASSRVTRLDVTGRQTLTGGYERVFGLAHGVVAPSERRRIAGLEPDGLRYAVQFELIRPAAGSPRSRTALVEAENRGAPLFLDALLSLDPVVGGAPAVARYPTKVAGGFLRRQGLSYAGDRASRLPGRRDPRRSRQLDGDQPTRPRRAATALPASRRPATLAAAPPAPPGQRPVPGRLDGQPRGGVRLPEVEHPLGRLQPVSIPPVGTKSISDVCGNSGGLDPFPRAALRRRYGSLARYRSLYGRSFSALLDHGFLLRPDRRRMLRAAAAAYRAAAG